MSRQDYVRCWISGVAVLILALHLLFPRFSLDTVGLGLVGLSALPWLAFIIESAKLPGGIEFTLRQLEGKQAEQRQDLDMILKFLLDNFVSKYERIHLEKLANSSSFPFNRSDSFEAELRRLLGLGLIQRKPGKGIRSMFQANDDAHHHLEITERGRQYLTYTQQLAPHV